MTALSDMTKWLHPLTTGFLRERTVPFEKVVQATVTTLPNNVFALGTIPENLLHVEIKCTAPEQTRERSGVVTDKMCPIASLFS